MLQFDRMMKTGEYPLGEDDESESLDNSCKLGSSCKLRKMGLL